MQFYKLLFGFLLLTGAVSTALAEEPTAQQIEEAKRKIAAGHGSRPGTQNSPMSVVETCQAMRRNIRDWNQTEQNAYQRKGCWHKMQADNGASFQIDLGLIQSLGAGATTTVYNDEGGTFDVMNMKRWYFTCTGYFSVMQNDMRQGPTIYAPPLSVAAQISQIARAGAHAKP